MAPTLPHELVSLVIHELFMDADPPPHQITPRELVHAFTQLRLVARHVKADAHLAWPGGLALLSNGAAVTAAKLLLPGVSQAAFQRVLDESRSVFQETSKLCLFLNRWVAGDEEKLLGVVHDQAWFYLAKQILLMTRALQHLKLYANGASLALRELPLAHLRLKQLCLEDTWKESLVGLDLSQMNTLDLLEVARDGEDWDVGEANLSGFRLPPRASTIKLKWMELSSDRVEVLALPSIATLRHLDLAGSQLTRPLPDMPALRQLSLSGAQIDNHFLRSLASWNALKRLDIPRTPVTDVTALALATNTSIERLNASRTDITHPAVFGLSTNTTLQGLDVGGSALTSFAFGLPSNTTLKELSLSCCRFTVPLMLQLVGELAGNGTLAILDLTFCHLTDELMAHFKLEKTSGLEELNLSQNFDLTNEGLEPLGDNITKHGLLRKLDLRYCVELTEPLVARLCTPSRKVIHPSVDECYA